MAAPAKTVHPPSGSPGLLARLVAATVWAALVVVSTSLCAW